MGLFLGAC